MHDDELEPITKDVIQSIERSAEVYGLSRSAGRVYGVLYLADRPLSIPELVEETGYAKSTISTVTRKLVRIGLVRRRSSSGGGRRIRFEPETDLWFVVRDVFQQYLLREMELTHRTLDRALDRLSTLDEPEARAQFDHVAELQETYAKLETLLELVADRSTDELIEAIEQYDEIEQ